MYIITSYFVEGISGLHFLRFLYVDGFRWMFAYTCILEATVRRRRKMWSWENIRDHRQLCRKYSEYYKAKLVTNKPSSDLLNNIEVG